MDFKAFAHRLRNYKFLFNFSRLSKNNNKYVCRKLIAFCWFATIFYNIFLSFSFYKISGEIRKLYCK